MEAELATSALVLPGEASLTSISAARPVGTTICLAVADILAIALSLVLAAHLRGYAVGGPAPPVVNIVFLGVILTVCSLMVVRLYPGVCENPVDELRRCVLAITLAFLSLGASTFLSRDMSQSRLTFVFGWALSIFLLPLLRSLARSLFANEPWWGSPVAILGLGKTGKILLDTLSRNPRVGLKPVAVLDDNPAQYAHINKQIVVGPLSKCLEIARDQRISYAIVCMPGLSRKELLQLMDRYGHCFRHIMVIPDLIGMASLGLSVREVGGVIGLEVTQRLLRPSAQFIKRALDLLLVLAGAPVVAPLVFLTALLIRIESRGPAFYRNERIGRGGRKFYAWKLRSMVMNGNEVLEDYLKRNPDARVQWNATQKLKRDPRVTRMGRIIRKTSIDELPQLWNVLIGEMSIVGPRPFLESQVEMYGPAYHLYQRVRPGITGLWQISGRNELTFRERARLDAYTIQNWSVWLDLYILARTVSVVLTTRGAY
jgi:Undecaprenyl-phosphate galactose phosphotransferase WbaP